MTEEIYKVEKLFFEWNKNSNYILENVSFSIKKGAFTMIIGKNGSGKTTLLKLLANFFHPGHGKIYFYGKETKSIKRGDFAKQVAYVAQNPDEKIPITVKEVVNLGNFPNQTFFHSNDRELNKRLIESLEITETIDFQDRFFPSLSGGEKQKVMIARALCQNTSVILLDEPTSSLDIKNKVEIMKLLQSFVKKKNISLVLVSHNLNLVSNFADEVILLHNKNVIYGNNKMIMKPNQLQKAFETEISMIKHENKTIFFY
ncbi:MAG: ABC transporter ATP-binding protein [Spirochaetes bacterium]|nr:ABC transporter ATP-binding protein [Spirochaetota bacterium]